MQTVYETLDKIEGIKTSVNKMIKRASLEADEQKRIKITAELDEYMKENGEIFDWHMATIPNSGGSTNQQQMNKFLEVVKYLRLTNTQILEGKVMSTIRGDKLMRDMSDTELASLEAEYKLITPTHLVNKNNLYITDMARILLEKFENKMPFKLSDEMNRYLEGQKIEQEMIPGLEQEMFKYERQAK